MMKRLLFTLIALVLALGAIPVARAEGVDGWTVTEGSISKVTAPVEGVRIEGSSIDATYTSDMFLEAFMTDLYVDLTSIDFGSETPVVTFDVMSGDETLYTMTLTLGETKYDVALGLGTGYTLSNVAYGEGGRIQLRLAYDNVMDFETGTRVDAWNMVAGCNPTTNKSVNRIRDDAFTVIDSALSERAESEISVRVALTGISNDTSVILTQICYDCFYTYETLPAPAVPTDEDLTYSKINLSWTPPTTEVLYGGYVVERYNGDVLEAIYNLNDKHATSLSEKKLDQGTTYTYVIKAFEKIDLFSSKVACTKIAFEYEPVSVTTPKGDPTVFIIVCVLCGIALAGVILGYIYWYSILGFVKKLFKKA